MRVPAPHRTHSSPTPCGKTKMHFWTTFGQTFGVSLLLLYSNYLQLNIEMHKNPKTKSLWKNVNSIQIVCNYVEDWKKNAAGSTTLKTRAVWGWSWLFLSKAGAVLTWDLLVLLKTEPSSLCSWPLLVLSSLLSSSCCVCGAWAVSSCAPGDLTLAFTQCVSFSSDVSLVALGRCMTMCSAPTSWGCCWLLLIKAGLVTDPGSPAAPITSTESAVTLSRTALFFKHRLIPRSALLVRLNSLFGGEEGGWGWCCGWAEVPFKFSDDTAPKGFISCSLSFLGSVGGTFFSFSFSFLFDWSKKETIRFVESIKQRQVKVKSFLLCNCCFFYISDLNRIWSSSDITKN